MAEGCYRLTTGLNFFHFHVVYGNTGQIIIIDPTLHIDSKTNEILTDTNSFSAVFFQKRDNT